MHSFILGVGAGGAVPARLGRGPALIVLAAFVLAVTLTVVTVALLAWRGPRPSRGEDEADSGPGGGGGPRRPGPPVSPGGDSSWWPEFERQFAAYVNSQNRGPRRARQLDPVSGSSG